MRTFRDPPPPQIANAVSFLLFLIVPFSANSSPFNGIPKGQIFDGHGEFTLANWAYAIWAIIYLLFGFFTIFQALPTNRNDETVRYKINFHLFVVELLCVIWIPLWAHELYYISIFFTFTCAAVTLRGYISLDIGNNDFTKSQYVAYELPFKLFFPWMTLIFFLSILI